MNFKIRCQGLFFGTVFLLVGCFGDGGSDYPPLKKSQLVGCWMRLVPEIGTPCQEECFSNSNAFYLRANDRPSQSLGQTFSEFSGQYQLDGGVSLTVNAVFKNNVQDTINRDKYTDSYTIINDTLNSISPSGELSPFIRSDSIHNCGPHWMLFPKPADWELP